MSKLVCGVGFNDKTRPVFVDGKSVKEYKLWQDMLRRCFIEKYQTRYPTYKGCNVSDNFLNYSYFYDWCQGQIGFGKVDEKGRSWCLDKVMPDGTRGRVRLKVLKNREWGDLGICDVLMQKGDGRLHDAEDNPIEY